MNCNHCEEHISDYLEDALGAGERQAMNAHFAACNACSEMLAGIRSVVAWGPSFPVYEPPPWLATQIVARTPHVVRETWLDMLVAVGKWWIQPRTAMALFTATMVIGWIGGALGLPHVNDAVRNPVGTYYRAEEFVNRAYGSAIHRYSNAPLVTEIRFQIERLREIS